MSEWFEHWFGEEYLELYPHRDDEEAARVAALLKARRVVRAGDRVVDLACGTGRHTAALAGLGARVVGLDLSLPLLRIGRARRSGAQLVRGDIRLLPLRTGSADAVVNLFTSFGYFDRDAEDQRVLADVARVLRAGGRFVLDFLNAPQVRATLVPRDERRINGRTVVQERRLDQDGRYVIKTIRLAGEGKSFMERVRLYERADLERLMAAAGLVTELALGDYAGGPWDTGSPRLFLVARKP